MKYFFTFLSLVLSIALFSRSSSIRTTAVSPLASFSEKWNDVKYNSCNTAANVAYMDEDEKNVIYILNLVRTNPKLFANTVLKKYPSLSGKDYLVHDTYYYQSLVNNLLTLEPKGLLYPDSLCYNSAQCHANTSGISGYVGHVRKNNDCKTKKHYYGECCDYGNSDPLEIVLNLLIDKGVPSLGHREACLTNYSKIGVSIQPHIKYNWNTVLDFYY